MATSDKIELVLEQKRMEPVRSELKDQLGQVLAKNNEVGQVLEQTQERWFAGGPYSEAQQNEYATLQKEILSIQDEDVQVMTRDHQETSDLMDRIRATSKRDSRARFPLIVKLDQLLQRKLDEEVPLREAMFTRREVAVSLLKNFVDAL